MPAFSFGGQKAQAKRQSGTAGHRARKLEPPQ